MSQTPPPKSSSWRFSSLWARLFGLKEEAVTEPGTQATTAPAAPSAEPGPAAPSECSVASAGPAPASAPVVLSPTETTVEQTPENTAPALAETSKEVPPIPSDSSSSLVEQAQITGPANQICAVTTGAAEGRTVQPEMPPAAEQQVAAEPAGSPEGEGMQAPPVAQPVEIPSAIPLGEQPVPATALPVATPVVLATPVVPGVESQTSAAPSPEAIPLAEPVTVAVPETLPPCPVCCSPRQPDSRYCSDCGYLFEAERAAVPASVSSMTTSQITKINNRYEVVRLLNERGDRSRWEGRDLSVEPPQPVVLVRQRRAVMPAKIMDAPMPTADDEDEILPTFDDAGLTAFPSASPVAPPFSLEWERRLLEPGHPALPQVRDLFSEGEFDYLVEELPTGRSLWDAWDDPEADASQRYGWLKQIAEGLHHLHQGGALVEGLCPDDVIVDDHGQARLANLTGLLPFPVPEGVPVRDSLYTAPELLLSPQQADARADLYSFGAMIYSLEYLHHSLEEKDFIAPFQPQLITDRYPDAHPALCRLINKTFCRDVHTRFPTEEAGKADPSGFQELIQTLEVCQRTFDLPRLDIAAWTTTGMVRSGNEDAFAFLHAVQGTQDDIAEYALILLCDGMGGYEAGEVAAALAIREMRQFLLAQPLFAALAGQEPPPPGTFSVEACKEALRAALQHANQVVYAAARAPGSKRRGMGCTAEVVYVDPRHLIVGHVGDSRTYHLSRGRLRQLTRDQTLVNRLVELGQLTPEEAENHPRKNELQQAIGGQPMVEPGLYSSRLARGDWVLVCSDGLTNHIPAADLELMLLRETIYSAEEAARRLINLVNLRGATDNATVALVRLS